MEGDSLPTSSSFTGKPLALLATTLSNSLIVKVSCALIVILYLCSFNSVLFDQLSVIPGYVLPPNFRVWTLISHSFLQSQLPLVLVDILVVFSTGALLEPAYKPLQLAIFFGLVTVCSALASSLSYMFLYYITRNTDYLFETRIHGLAAYAGGLAVAFKQLMPDKALVVLPWGKFRHKQVPFVFAMCSIALAALHLIPATHPLQVGFGVIVSWIYLRFYQKHENGSMGDMAEEFCFASFFPGPTQLPIAIISNTIFSLLIRFKVCKKPQRKYDVSSPTTITVTLPGTDPADAERRRQLAIKALNDRLNATTDSERAEETHWPGLVDDDDDSDSGNAAGADSQSASQAAAPTTTAAHTGGPAPVKGGTTPRAS